MDPEIVQYIRDHRDTYTRKAITQHLLDAGHTQEAIDAAWRQTVEAGQQETPVASTYQGTTTETQPILKQGRFWLAMFGYIVGLLLITNLLNVMNIFFGLLFYAVALLVGLIYPLVRFQKDRAVATGILCGLAVIVVLLFAMPGLCTVAAGDSLNGL